MRAKSTRWMSSCTGIVGTLLLCTAAVRPALATEGSSTPSTVFFNAHVFTAEYDHPYAEAVAIRGEHIIAVGTRDSVEQAAGPGARHVDLKGQFLMPGMIDAHVHPIMGGITLIQREYVQRFTSVAAMLAVVREEIVKHQSFRGDVLVIGSLDLSNWSHATEIDAALSEGEFAAQPIYLVGNDGHTAWANRAVRVRAGITKDFIAHLTSGDRRYYGFDADLNPNGFVVDVGKTKVDERLPPYSPEFMLRAGRAAVRYLNGFGITGWLDPAVSGVVGGSTPASADDPGFLPVYRDLAQRGELTAHVAAYPVVQPDLGTPQIEVVEALRKEFQGVPNLVIPGLKVFADGVVEYPSQTAALTLPYGNTGQKTPLLFTPEKMKAFVTEATRRGLNVHIHAIGNLAVKASLDAFEAARKAMPQSHLPYSLTHAQFVDLEDIPRFAQLHVIAALQLLWAQANSDSVDVVKPYIDPSIYRWMYPARSILDAGGEIAGASDWFVSSPNPFLAMVFAETRTGPEGVLDPAQRMPREAMLYAYTRHSAHALDMLDEIGSIAPGKRADLVLVDRDVMTVPVDELKQAAVVWTMLGGKVVFGQGP